MSSNNPGLQNNFLVRLVRLFIKLPNQLMAATKSGKTKDKIQEKVGLKNPKI